MMNFMEYRKLLRTGLLLSLVGVAWSAQPNHLIMKAKIRDFREYNPTDSSEGTHPHFNTKTPCSAHANGLTSLERGIAVNDSPDGDVFEGDNRGPRLANPMPAGLGPCFDPVDRFSDWFQDRGPEINRAFRVELRFLLDTATGLYRFSSDAFFPIDSGKAFSKFKPGDPDPFGHLQTGTLNGVDLSKHNYGFTMELHSTFQYHRGKNQAFYFAGDDDVWVFMNGKLVLDLGGIHPNEQGTVMLDSLGLDSGSVYPLDLFFAERRTSSSTCTITTSLELQSSVVSVATPQAGPLGDTIPIPRKVGLTSLTPDAVIYYTIDGSTPDSTKTKYEDSITVSAGTTLKAIAYRSGWLSSEVMTETFTESVVSIARSARAARATGRPGEIRLANAPNGVRITLHDRRGRTIRVLSAGSAAADGARSVIWNGRDGAGRIVAPGIYFWRAAHGDSFQGGTGTVLAPR